MASSGRNKTRRSYTPAVEALEALRPLSGASVSTTVPLGLVSEQGLADPIGAEQERLTPTAWDVALAESALPVADTWGPAVAEADPSSIQSGLAQLNRYLSRAWYRAGIDPQQHDDCSQAVYMTMLQNLGRDRFDSLMGAIGEQNIRDVLSRDTAEGPDFFRVVDTVKKRAQRERLFQPLDEALDVSSAGQDGGLSSDRRGELDEAIRRSLSPREAALIQATLQGETPMEIASGWGVAPKTVSNEKTRALQKLRDVLVAEVD